MSEQNKLPAILGKDPAVWIMAVYFGIAITVLLVSFWEPSETVILKLWELISVGRCPKLEAFGSCIYLHEDVWASTKRIFAGVVGALFATLVVLFSSLFPRLSVVVLWVIVALYAIPSAAFYMGLLLYVGFGEFAKVTAMFWTGMVGQAIFAAYATRSFVYGKGNEATRLGAIYDQLQLDGVGRFRLLWEHMLPMLSDRLFGGLAIMVPVFWKITILFEVVGSSGDGLGYLMFQGLHMGQKEGLPLLLAGIFTVSVCTGISVLLIYLSGHAYGRKVYRTRLHIQRVSP